MCHYTNLILFRNGGNFYYSSSFEEKNKFKRKSSQIYYFFKGLGRIRSFSEDRKPGRWLPEDQWAVRQPGSTCPEPCDKPKKPTKPSKSWLSVCKDPEVPLECDVRHSNCPPPPVKTEEPWYSLDNLISKKKQDKPPPLRTCREEIKRRELYGEKEEVCENIVDRNFIVDIKPEPTDCCTSKQEPCPAPVIMLSCPPPKELDLMLWCGQPSKESTRIAIKCQSDNLPYQEFRPQKAWKPPPFSLPKSNQVSLHHPCCNVGPIPFSEYKQVEIPKPLYTRYKSVELRDSNFMLCMVDATCPDVEQKRSLAITPFPNPKRIQQQPTEVCKKSESCPEKPLIQTGACKPVRIKNAPKYTFRPKPTKLVEKRVPKNPFAQHKSCDLKSRNVEENERSECTPTKSTSCTGPSKVITGTLTDEPQIFERNLFSSRNPPKWMYVLRKPGAKDTPLVPSCEQFPEEPDWVAETDGLKFYDGNDEGISPKPLPDPCTVSTNNNKETAPAPSPEPDITETQETLDQEYKNRFVLMPESFNIRNTRVEDPAKDDSISSSFEEFLEAQTAPSKKCTKSYPPMKENILYDLQRICSNPPFDPSKFNAPCRKLPKEDCSPQHPRFYRNFSTLSPATFNNLRSAELCKTQRRTECGDSTGKCKVRALVPKSRECVEKPKVRYCPARSH